MMPSYLYNVISCMSGTFYIECPPGLLLLTWFDFNMSMDK